MHPLKLHNSLTRKLEDFVPENPERVTMYACGLTVYDTPHIGNARPAIVFDVLYRILMHEYGQDNVVYARNITDIDDKIIERAKEHGISISELTESVELDVEFQMEMLNVLSPNFEPHASSIESMGAILEIIERLISRGHAYVADGHVLFDVASHPGHGVLSGHLQENLKAGHRVAVESYKRNPGDFVLWKPSDPDQPGWLSAWGRGRPGWHIECSAMIYNTLGLTIDIHGGGADLRFPHHDCEISQSVCAHGTDELARYWLHNGLVLVDGEKMAKSAGNFLTVEEVLDRHRAQSVRLWMLSTHYRSPIDYTDEAIEQARQTLISWHRSLLMRSSRVAIANEHSEPAMQALLTDLNTPLAITRLHEKFSEMEKADETVAEQIAAGIRYVGMMMGIDLVDSEDALMAPHFKSGVPIVFPIDVKKFVEERNYARENKQWDRADQIRTILNENGVILEDAANESVWYYAR